MLNYTLKYYPKAKLYFCLEILKMSKNIYILNQDKKKNKWGSKKELPVLQGLNFRDFLFSIRIAYKLYILRVSKFWLGMGFMNFAE